MRKPAILLFCLLCSQSLFAQVVSPASVSASSTFFSYTLEDLINQDGIVGGLDSGTHVEDYETMWMSDFDDITAELIFDLGAEQTFSNIRVWQYNAVCCGLERGVNELDIYLSDDDISYSFAGNFSLSQSPGGNIPAQTIPLGATARYVRFNIVSNHGDANYVGLSEVAFDLNASDPTPAPPATPVPTLSPLGVLLAVLMTLLLGAAGLHRRLN